MPVKTDRHSGILLHPTSLPGPHGSGDLGPAAYHFVDWLVAGAQTRWQILPLGGIGPGNSPYMSPSALAGNELLIDLAQLHAAGWLSAAELIPERPFATTHVDYPAVRAFRQSRLRLAAECFFAQAPSPAHAAFAAFCQEKTSWLDDYALFMALDAEHGGQGKVWQDWPAPLVRREPKALRAAQKTLAAEYDFWRFSQWCFHEQWARLKAYANARQVKIIGDMPIFVSPHSADVWAHQSLFDLDAHGRPRVVAGVPPDYFSTTGQHWGNPLYDWPAHQKEGYDWWIERMHSALALCDLVRIDHFRGFESYWEIPADAPSAINGQWRAGPGVEFFNALQKSFKQKFAAREALPNLSHRIIAEDLGIITAAVTALRQSLNLPGMCILQFAFDGKSDNFYLPHNFEHNTVVYTGTHDNDTSQGWWQSLAPHEQDYVRRYLGIDGNDIHWALIRVASASIAALSIIPMQDVLGLGSAHRMNRPSVAKGSWEWRFDWAQVEAQHADQLAELTHLHGRTGEALNY